MTSTTSVPGKNASNERLDRGLTIQHIKMTVLASRGFFAA